MPSWCTLEGRQKTTTKKTKSSLIIAVEEIAFQHRDEGFDLKALMEGFPRNEGNELGRLRDRKETSRLLGLDQSKGRGG